MLAAHWIGTLVRLPTGTQERDAVLQRRCSPSPHTHHHPVFPHQRLRQQNEVLRQGLTVLNTSASNRGESALDGLRRELGRAMASAQANLDTANALRSQLRATPRADGSHAAEAAPRQDAAADAAALQQELAALSAKHDSVVAELSAAQTTAASAERRARSAEDALEALRRRALNSEAAHEQVKAASEVAGLQAQEHAAAAASAKQEAAQLRTACTHLQEKVVVSARMGKRWRSKGRAGCGRCEW